MNTTPLDALAGAPRWLSAAVCCAALLAAGCDKKAPADPPKLSAEAAESGSPVSGIKPADADQAAASDRQGAPAVGSLEAGQAAGGHAVDTPQAPPTSGDGAASSPTR